MKSKTALIYIVIAVAAGLAALSLTTENRPSLPEDLSVSLKSQDQESKVKQIDDKNISLTGEVETVSRTRYDQEMKALEKISAELMAMKKRYGDDPRKMTSKELEDQVALMESYNRQFALVLDMAKQEL